MLDDTGWFISKNIPTYLSVNPHKRSLDVLHVSSNEGAPKLSFWGTTMYHPFSET